MCIALSLALNASSEPRFLQFFYASVVFTGICAVLLSNARGSYGILLWVGCVVLLHFARVGVEWRTLVNRIFLLVIGIVLLIQIFHQVASVPVQRIQLTLNEFKSMDMTKESLSKSSLGIRIYLSERALEEIPNHLWMGVGRDTRMAAIQRWGVEAQSQAVMSAGHLHNI